MGKKMRVDKLLSNVGVASRAELKKYCKQGLISVNGKVINNPGVQVDSESDDIRFNGEKIVYREFVYIMLNKPDGYISATFDKYDPIVLDLIDQSYLVFEPFPVGRLDKDTEGLLVLTNDGQLAHRVLSPKKHVPKTYYAKIQGKVTEEDILAFEKGVILDDGYETMPSQLKILKSVCPNLSKKLKSSGILSNKEIIRGVDEIELTQNKKYYIIKFPQIEETFIFISDLIQFIE